MKTPFIFWRNKMQYTAGHCGFSIFTPIPQEKLPNKDTVFIFIVDSPEENWTFPFSGKFYILHIFGKCNTFSGDLYCMLRYESAQVLNIHWLGSNQRTLSDLTQSAKVKDPASPGIAAITGNMAAGFTFHMISHETFIWNSISVSLGEISIPVWQPHRVIFAVRIMG